jgi:hypothetical protein
MAAAELEIVKLLDLASMANVHTKTELISLCLQFVLKKTHLTLW